ncbi:amidohydrolase family protein [Thalassotalea ponticola]|uniref:amidohydrolase family protein n=1 Tax=Thalassotalea ponticola TaxID=1523392 RepID=UPI0025B42807|nr:amidohydrolase family protein [Thalassotalea ponticola]MDN3652022.1 amidohydrolase family protein [Thalassotalea ponticola]
MLSKIIDPHVHLFNLEQGDYHWLDSTKPPYWPDKQRICHNYSDTDLKLPNGVQLGAIVHIEAGFDNSRPEREIAWLEQSVQTPLKTIAFADITAFDFGQRLHRLTQYQSVVGIRHILDHQASSILALAQTQQNLRILAEHALLFECQADLTEPTTLDHLLTILADNPALFVVINHCGFAGLPLSQPLHRHLCRLAHTGQVAIKCSGWEMTDRHWCETEMADMVTALLGIFTEQQLMMASNFPLSLLSVDYQTLWQRYLQLPVNSTTLQKICHDNSKRIYGL